MKVTAMLVLKSRIKSVGSDFIDIIQMPTAITAVAPLAAASGIIHARELPKKPLSFRYAAQAPQNTEKTIATPTIGEM
ncbi:MAG: hypothetical protein ACYS8W_13835 [Planctomycetota bacterium]